MDYLNFPIHINIYVTLRCNLRCRHCIDNASMKSGDPKTELTDEEIYHLLDYFLKNGVRDISFSGGEPLLRKSIFEFIRYLSKRGCRTTLLSNLTLLDKEKLRRLKDSGLYYVRTSLEGDNEKTHDYIRGKGNFKLLMEKFEMLKELKRTKKGVSVTIKKDNWKQLDGIAKLISEYGFTELTISLLMPAGRGERLSSLMLSKEELRSFFDYLEEFKIEHKNLNVHFESPLYALYLFEKKDERYKSYGPCLIGRTFLGIKANGDVYACPMRDEVIIGNVKQDDLFYLWHHSELLNRVRNLDNLTGKCKNCELRYICGGGCRAFTHIKYGDFVHPDPYCWKK